MRTSLSPERLAGLAAEGRSQADADRPFINPDRVGRAKDLLGQRGEEWAESVLMRRFTRRSIMLPALPWLEHGEIETLLLAENAEWGQLAQDAQVS